MLTPRQLDVLRALADWIEQNRYPPSLRELAAVTDIASISNVSYHLNNLARAGMLVREPESARTLYVTPQGYAALAHAAAPRGN